MRAAAIPFLPCRAPAGPSLPRPKAYAAAMNFLYLTDVFCPWCYGFAPVMRRLAAEHPELPVRVLGGNLMAEPQTLTGMLEEYPTIREFFVRLQETTGQTTEQFRLALEQAAAGTGPDLLMHSPAMNLPLAALRQLSPGHQLEQMEAFQMAFYAQGRDVMAAGEQEAIAAAWLPAGAAPGALAAVMADPAVREAARHDAAEAEEIKKQVTAQADRLKELETKEAELQDKIRDIMYTIPQMIDPSVPIGPDDSCNVEVQRFGDPVVPDYPIPYHVDIMESFDGIDLDAAGRVSGNGFYYLLGDIARLHEAVLAYARDFMIDKGFTYVIPPFMMHGDVVKGVMSFPEMDAMMYKIEGEDLYLIGTSEHTMIGRFIDQTLDGAKLPLTLTSYSPCFRKEKGAHGIEERGIYRIHQFEKQEMIVVCKPEDSMSWYDKLWHNSVELFRSMEIPVRQLECCSGDLADLKVKSCDIEAWSPRQQKYFEVCSCSNLGDAQARRLHIRYKDENGKTQLAHTLNNTCVAPPRMLIAFLENHLQADGTVTIPAVLQPYMGGKTVLVPKEK